jgi:hypothetical protein
MISGPELEEVVEADKKVRQYLKSQAPKKTGRPHIWNRAAPKP